MTDKAAPENTSRVPIPAQVDVAIFDTGYSGLCVANRMKLAGLHDFVLPNRPTPSPVPGATTTIPSSAHRGRLWPTASQGSGPYAAQEVHAAIRAGLQRIIHMIESQTRYVLDALRRMRRNRAQAVDMRAHTQRDYNAELQTRMRRTVWATGGCRRWYLSHDGSNATLWPYFTFRLRHKTRRFDIESYPTWAAP